MAGWHRHFWHLREQMDESMESSASGWRDGAEKVRALRGQTDESMESNESKWQNGTEKFAPKIWYAGVMA